MAAKSGNLVGLLIVVILVLGGVVYWQQGTHDCEKRFGPLETRFIPVKGCEIKMGDAWRGEQEMKDSVTQGVEQMKEGGKKVMEGIFGKPEPAPSPSSGK